MTRPERGLLSLDTPVTVRDTVTRLTRLDGTEAKPIARIEGVSSRSDVEAIRGEPLWVAKADAPPLEADEYWADDLVGLAVVDGAREVGVVERVMSMPSCELLVVGELLIPLIDDAVRTIDLDARRVDVNLEFLGEG